MYGGIGKYELPMYCLYIILHAGITHLIILLKPALEPRLWPFSFCKPSPSPSQAHRWAGLGRAWAGFGLWARPSTSLCLMTASNYSAKGVPSIWYDSGGLGVQLDCWIVLRLRSQHMLIDWIVFDTHTFFSPSDFWTRWFRWIVDGGRTYLCVLAFAPCDSGHTIYSQGNNITWTQILCNKVSRTT